jgi:hypothetical protein
VVARVHQCAACDLAICELCSARRPLASMLARITAATTSPSKITQALAVSRADNILLMQNGPQGTKPPSGVCSIGVLRQVRARTKAVPGALIHSAFAPARNGTHALGLMLQFQVNSGTEVLTSSGAQAPISY